MNKIFFLLIILISILAFDSYAQESLNEINKYNEGVINSLSIIIALIGGIVSILSPCAWPLIPAFLGFSLGERKGLINSAALFFIGLLFLTANIFAVPRIVTTLDTNPLAFMRNPYCIAVSTSNNILVGGNNNSTSVFSVCFISTSSSFICPNIESICRVLFLALYYLC